MTNSRYGNTITTLIICEMTVSTQPRKYPLIKPIRTPSETEPKVAKIPTSSDTCAP